MRRYSIFISLILLILLSSCGGSGDYAQLVSGFDSVIYKPKYASGFEILGRPGSKSSLIKVYSPWQGADSALTTLLICRGGEPAPADYKGQVLTEGDAKRIATMSSTHIAMLHLVGDADKIVGVSSKKYVCNPVIRKNYDNIGDIGYDGNIDYETILAIHPDIVLLYGVTGPSELEPRLKEMDIPFAYIADYLEDSPIGKAEWMIVAAEISGKRDEAIEAFTKIPERYNSMKELASQMTKRPKVMLNTPYGDSWLMSPSSSYTAQLVKDANGEYVYKSNDSNTTLAIDTEEAYKLVSESDYWLNVGTVSNLKQLKSLYPVFAKTKPVTTHGVYNCDRIMSPGGGMDYWESGSVHPDLVLRDLIKIFHPQLFADSAFVYYRQLN